MRGAPPTLTAGDPPWVTAGGPGLLPRVRPTEHWGGGGGIWEVSGELRCGISEQGWDIRDTEAEEKMAEHKQDRGLCVRATQKMS